RWSPEWTTLRIRQMQTARGRSCTGTVALEVSTGTVCRSVLTSPRPSVPQCWWELTPPWRALRSGRESRLAESGVTGCRGESRWPPKFGLSEREVAVRGGCEGVPCGHRAGDDRFEVVAGGPVAGLDGESLNHRGVVASDGGDRFV